MLWLSFMYRTRRDSYMIAFHDCYNHAIGLVNWKTNMNIAKNEKNTRFAVRMKWVKNRLAQRPFWLTQKKEDRPNVYTHTHMMLLRIIILICLSVSGEVLQKWKWGRGARYRHRHRLPPADRAMGGNLMGSDDDLDSAWASGHLGSSF